MDACSCVPAFPPPVGCVYGQLVRGTNFEERQEQKERTYASLDQAVCARWNSLRWASRCAIFAVRAGRSYGGIGTQSHGPAGATRFCRSIQGIRCPPCQSTGRIKSIPGTVESKIIKNINGASRYTKNGTISTGATSSIGRGTVEDTGGGMSN